MLQLRIGWFALYLQTPIASAQSFSSLQGNKMVIEEEIQVETPAFNKRANVDYGFYILGPGDQLEIELLDLPELSGNYSIGPDGTLYLPRLRALSVEGLTIEELRKFLTKQFKPYVRDPKIYVRPIAYRPIRIFVGGEVKRPGYYTLSGVQSSLDVSSNRGISNTTPFPTVFDAIRAAQGITPYSKLSEVEVSRKRSKSLGGGRIRTKLDFLSVITDGNETQNIRLFDGDVLRIEKSPVVLREQLLKAGQSNLSPQFMNVFVTGRVTDPGGVTIPQGGTLNQAISLAGGVKLIKGKVEFVRFNNEGTIDRRIFSYSPAAIADAPNNPILATGDIIRVQDSIISGSLNILNELTSPMIGIYSVYSLLEGVSQ